MKRETAERILEILERIDVEAKPLAEAIEQIDSVIEKKRMRRAYALLIGHLFTDLTLPIVKQYPELNKP